MFFFIPRHDRIWLRCFIGNRPFQVYRERKGLLITSCITNAFDEGVFIDGEKFRHIKCNKVSFSTRADKNLTNETNVLTWKMNNIWKLSRDSFSLSSKSLLVRHNVSNWNSKNSNKFQCQGSTKFALQRAAFIDQRNEVNVVSKIYREYGTNELCSSSTFTNVVRTSPCLLYSPFYVGNIFNTAVTNIPVREELFNVSFAFIQFPLSIVSIFSLSRQSIFFINSRYFST